MSYLEPLSFCSIEEYRRHEPNRLEFADVEVGELYTLMSELKGTDREASRSTIRVLGKSATHRFVTVVFHDEALEEVLEIDAAVSHENYIFPDKDVKLFDKRDKASAVMSNSYLRDYFQDMYDHILSESKELGLTGSR